MSEVVGMFLELLRESEDPRLADAFQMTASDEDRSFRIIEGLYACERGRGRLVLSSSRS